MVVISDSDSEAAGRCRTRLWERYPDSHALNEHAYLVDGHGAQPNDIAETLGFRVEDETAPACGVVFGIGPFYSGFTRPETWDWLGRVDPELQ